MTPEEFLRGRLTGFGCVQGLSGRILRRYTIEMTGVWSDEHRALHLDETYTYVGREDEPLRRSWVVHTDEQGFILGHDAHQAARFRAWQDGADLRLIFDRPSRPGGKMEPRQLVRVIEIGPTEMMLLGRIVMLGLPIATMHSALSKVD